MTPPILSFNNFVKDFEKFQLKGNDLSIPKGEITAVVGDEGAGKTTLLELIMGLRTLDSGTIERSLVSEDDSITSFKAATGFVYDDLYFYDFGTLNDLSRMMSEVYPSWEQKIFHKYSAEFGLPAGQKFRDFSSEMKMKTMLATGLSHHPELLIMDEPVKSLETKARFEFFKLLRQLQKKEELTIIITSQNASSVEKFATNMLFMHEGEFVLEGRPRELKKQYKTLDIAYKSAIGGTHK